jgi:hypothetical protein
MADRGASLRASLEAFQRQVNENTRLAKLVAGWNPHILVESVDDEARFTMVVRDAKIAEIKEGFIEGAKTIRVRADTPTLERLFAGELNPAVAVIEGEIEVYGKEPDLVKLDAVTLVLWDK